MKAPHGAAIGGNQMKNRRFTLALSALALATASFAANAAIVFQNLGTNAPPAIVGGHAVTPFDQAAQAAIPNFTENLTVIPGNPGSGSLGVSFGEGNYKGSIGSGWATWSHGYTGAIYYVGAVTETTLVLPANTKAFYFYVEPNDFGAHTFTATTSNGGESGAISVIGASGATGFAFYGTQGESITSITISSDEGAGGFAIGEFGINAGPAKTCASEGYTNTKLLWCQNICEKGYTGATLDTWIHRWINRYRDLPYCAQEGGGEEEPPPQDA